MNWKKALVVSSLASAVCCLNYVRHEGCVEFKAPKPDEKSVLFSEANGRLGNNLLMYAVMLQLQISLGVDAYINDEAIVYMRRFFTRESIKLKSFQETFCNYDQVQWVFYYKHIRPLLTDKSYRKGKTLYLWPMTGNEDDEFGGYRSESHHCIEHENLVRAYHRTMKNTLVFKPHIMEKVIEIYDEVARKMGKKKKDLYFVAIHNRRTDHIAYTKKKFNQKPLKPDYFYDAMDAFREHEDNVVFLMISDDMAWARKNIKDKHNDLFFVGLGVTDDDWAIGVDLALVSSGNGTIITRGTYSMWGSILSGGVYHTEYGMIIPEWIMDPDHEFFKEDYIIP